MIIENNPATKQQHDNWQLRIKSEFPNTDFSFSSDYLCLIHYLDKTPQKFYSKEAFKQYLSFLENAKVKDPKLLSNILIDAEPLLSISNKILTEVNNKPVHDTFLPKEHNDLINFIDKDIHYNLLKIYETPFFHLSKIVAKYHWIKDNKSTDGLDLYNSVEQLKKVDFTFVERFYLHDVRNGIAHGKIIFSDMDITYIDKKGGKTIIPTRKIIDTLDGILDITNGFCLAFKVFSLTNSVFFESYKIQIPQSILLEELQAKANGPAWTITNCLESVAMRDKKQLIIYVKNDNWDYNKVNWYSFTTALWAEALTKSYERIFFSLHSTHNRISPTGWAGYDATMFRRLREIDEMRFEAFIGVLENDYVYFIPKIKFPKFIYKIGTFLSVIKITLPLEWRKYVDTYFPNPFFIRETQIHSKKNFSVVQDPSVIIKPNFQNDVEGLIRDNKKRIMKLAINYSRKQCSRYSLTRYLPVKYARVFIYDTDKRVRNLRNSGLTPELIATIEVNTTKHIKTIDIINGTPEQIGKYRIVWNKRWQEKKQKLA
ncbi:hypothetical protein [Flavobacterium sp. WC2429]|uniref:Uncharacterized protein n=1 Tax=Flavobacterium sp. WC2429 TaxID=3234140 RepID=A0AB39WM96_9FLAO